MLSADGATLTARVTHVSVVNSRHQVVAHPSDSPQAVGDTYTLRPLRTWVLTWDIRPSTGGSYVRYWCRLGLPYPLSARYCGA